MTEQKTSSSSHLLSPLFQSAEAFLDLLLKQSIKKNSVIVRRYCNGAWQQLSGKDFCAHLGRAVAYWMARLPPPCLENPKQRQSLILLGRNTYHSFVALWGGILAGFDVMCAPLQMTQEEIRWCLNYFKGVAIATEEEDIGMNLACFSVPIIKLSLFQGVPQDKHPEPPLLSLYREYKLAQSSHLHTHHKILPPHSPWRQTKPGRFAFVSCGHDGFQKPEILKPDALVLTAQNFIFHAEFPKQIFWKSLELLPQSSPFAHLSRYCALLKNGIIGFPKTDADWETNLRILKPSYLFASSPETEQLCRFVNTVAKRSQHHLRFQLSEKIETVQNFLATNQAMKIPENTFDFLKRTLRKASRMIAGQHFLKEAIEDLNFVVHGLAPASETAVRMLEKLGLPVIETYGTTHGAGMLSSNLFHATHHKTIGTPLPHVHFRLGTHSTLEYRVTPRLFEHFGTWQETGDVAQMTPFGFLMTGRQKHLFVTLGGILVSPARLEQLLKEDNIISDACVIGDKMPYLSALIVLNHTALADYREHPEKIKEQVQSIINCVNETLPRNVTLKKFSILERPFTELSGEKLSNGEINRIKIQETRSDFIAALYR